MNFFALSATLDDIDLTTDDEIGIFDGEYCVGVGVLDSEIADYFSLVASTDDPSTSEIDGFISGNDSYAEVIVGRFSGNNPSEISTQVERSLTYEQSPSQVDHFNNALGIASNQGPGMNGYTDDDFNEFIDFDHFNDFNEN